LEKSAREGESPVSQFDGNPEWKSFLESRTLGFVRKMMGYSSQNAKYGRQTDSKQVQRWKDEKALRKQSEKCVKLTSGNGEMGAIQVVVGISRREIEGALSATLIQMEFDLRELEPEWRVSLVWD
jgi:hypothetical protein